MNDFVAFRKPGEQTATLLMQPKGEPETFDNITQAALSEGYVFAPFNVSAQTPIVIIQADNRITGDVSEIVAHLKEISDGALVHHDCMETEKSKRAETTTPKAQAKANAAEIKSLKEDYANDFFNFHQAVSDGRFKKLVLARSENQSHQQPPSVSKLFALACNTYSNAFVSLIYTSRTGMWLTATPELLLAGDGRQWQTIALAGTMKGAGRWSRKNQEEQALVSQYITKKIQELQATYQAKGPITKKAAHLRHLCTEYTFRTNVKLSATQILEKLHPTPAVCGIPCEQALGFIKAQEHARRAYYAGYSGMLSKQGQNFFYVTLRCMKIEKETITTFAGGGVMPDSVVEKEWEETCMKMNTMKRLLDTV